MLFKNIILFLSFVVFFYFSACNSQEKTESSPPPKDTVKIIQKAEKQLDTLSESAKIQEEIAKEFLPAIFTFQQVEDTLKKLADRDSISLYKKGYRLNIGKANGVKYAFIASYSEQPEILHHYLYKNNKWIKMYDIPYKDGSFYIVKAIDINQDNYKDLMVSTTIGVSANLLPYIFLYEPQKKLFIYKKYLSLTNMEINIKDSLITSSWFGSVCSTQSKSLYKWQADSVLLIEDYEIIPNCGEDEGFSEFKHYRNENDKISESTKKYKTEKAWEVFDKAVFSFKK